MPNPKTPPFPVSVDARVALERMARSQSLPARTVLAARGLVMAADGFASIEIARRLSVSPDRVRRWRASFQRAGVEGVGRIAPGRGRKPSLPDGTVARIVAVTDRERPADGSTHWTTRSLAAKLGVSHETVRRVWADHGLKPWRVETFKLSNDPAFEAKLVDVVGLYLHPPERAVVLCFDEKTQVQALDRTQPSLPMTKGRGQTMTHDSNRNGTTDLFAALDITTGHVHYETRQRHTATDVVAFFKQIDRAIPADLAIHVVLDNLSAHHADGVTRWLASRRRKSRWTLHYTPTSSSWLNLVEGWFAQLTNRRLRRGSFTSVQHLIDAISLWADEWNRNPKPFLWKATADQIIEKVRRGREALNGYHNESVADH